MERKYFVAFVFSTVVVTTNVITGLDDEEMIAETAIREIMRETGLDVSSASWEVEEL